MSEYVIIASNGNDDFYLTTDKTIYLDALAHKPNEVGAMCWSQSRDDAKGFTEQEVSEIMHGVESILMVPDEAMRWEVK